MTETQTTFEQISAGCYANADWSVVIQTSDRGWTVSEYGKARISFDDAQSALDWAARWIRGECRA